MMAINHNSVGLDGANATSSTLTVSECNRIVEYNCVLLHTSNERRMTIEAVPMFVRHVSTAYIVPELSTVSFDCEATGCPFVTVSWNGTPSRVPTGCSPYQRLFLVEPKDSGQFSCEVKNAYGMIGRQFQLSVTGKVVLLLICCIAIEDLFSSCF